MKKYVSSIVSVRIDPYNSAHIRPLAVSPLNYPESVPTPWGFPFSGRRGCTSCGMADWMPVEGIKFILDPMWQQINADLFEHINGLQSGLNRPGNGQQSTVNAPITAQDSNGD